MRFPPKSALNLPQTDFWPTGRMPLRNQRFLRLQPETESPEQEERILFLNVMAEGNDIRIDQIKSAMTSSPREGITWGQSRFNRRSGATDMEIFCTVNSSTRPSDLINDLQQIEGVYMVETLADSGAISEALRDFNK